MSYHCTNCGAEMNPDAAICINCGFAKGTAKHYCANCGNPVDENAVVCLKCGFALPNAAGASAAKGESSGSSEILFGKRAQGNEPTGSKSRLAAGLLYIFLSGLGLGDFYLGYTKTGLIRIGVTFIGMWIVGLGLLVNFVWAIMAAVNVFTDKTLDADGFALKK